VQRDKTLQTEVCTVVLPWFCLFSGFLLPNFETEYFLKKYVLKNSNKLFQFKESRKDMRCNKRVITKYKVVLYFIL
jgi:hypothetical protein